MPVVTVPLVLLYDAFLNSYKLSLLSCRPTDSTVDRTSPFFIFLSFQTFSILASIDVHMEMRLVATSCELVISQFLPDNVSDTGNIPFLGQVESVLPKI